MRWKKDKAKVIFFFKNCVCLTKLFQPPTFPLIQAVSGIMKYVTTTHSLLRYAHILTNPSAVREIEKLNRLELEAGVGIGASWHNDYNDTAYIFIGGLQTYLNEGDVLSIFSQYGIPVHVKLVRDKETGKSQGFGFLKYEDQRSTVLAVDNFNGIDVLGRKLRVDHTYYKAQEELEELEAEMAFDDYLDKVEEDMDKDKDKDKDAGKARRHKSDRHRSDRHKSDRHKSDRHSDRHNKVKHSSHRDRSRSPRESQTKTTKIKTEDDLEKEQEDPMAQYFRSKQR